MTHHHAHSGSELSVIHHGRWQDTIRGTRCQSLISDPPYSPRTHEGRRTGSEIRQSGIEYAALTVRDAVEFVRAWDGFVDEWWVLFGDDESVRWWRRILSGLESTCLRRCHGSRRTRRQG